MNAHAAILPILIPFAAALLQLAGGRRGLPFQRNVGLGAALLGIIATAWLVQLADAGAMLVYALGNWTAPFGIVLAVDRLAAGMSLLTALLAGASLLYASGGFDSRGRHFHPLFQLQIMGIQGAFLTGDLFNLFVFFEVMLLASYALLAHGEGLARTRAGLAYVVLNLAGSALFLIALGLLYGTLGTLNLADVALRLQNPDHNIALARLAGALLIAVFALKAALLPLSFWLPHAYASAGAPVAALFVIMTKVGIVAILRVQAVAFAPAATMADLLDWLVPLALATLLFAALGALAATRLRYFAAWLVLVSAGTLLVVPSYAQAGITAAALYYLFQSTFVVAAFFLLAELIAERRGKVSDAIKPGPAFHAPWLALGFFLAAISVAGLPPLSGFLGKLMLLSAVRETPAGPAIWIISLTAGFLIMAALARAGSRLFWKHKSDTQPHATPTIAWQPAAAVLLLVAAGPLLALFARPVSDYAARAAVQLHTPGAYVNAVLGTNRHTIIRETRP
ncbi:NADH/ubiquinone/plastoquinone (complex I) [Sulfuricella denitrificans skB26]|uniref:NADH/ubiquinone/plastoquinone (Complex I) n=1 Tax=Sulfuricella denitrificans (strain DSM 22764 / NBRC 105220 / skB26) TaxID=1163617 RepID=S6B5K0_SULDS|nr:monovalent cation/H+ antiporter subunit D [Sulfuricella denitrificans]BAN35812.1 NADH/ubiquinone/plastoquinone (complex I) [Sulfuricella denitrificans skB26]